MHRDDIRRFTGVTFFIGFTENGATKEARQFVDESTLWSLAQGGSEAVRNFLLEGPIDIMVKELLKEFLKDFVEQEKYRKEVSGLMDIFSSGGPAKNTVRRVRELLGGDDGHHPAGSGASDGGVPSEASQGAMARDLRPYQGGSHSEDRGHGVRSDPQQSSDEGEEEG